MQLHVFSGTKAQYIKTAPLLRLLDERGIAYRLIDSGQHAEQGRQVRRSLGLREPDVNLGGHRDVATVLHGVAWSLRLLALWLRPAHLRREVFGGAGGICVVHGDTVSTLLAALLARRAGLRVAHLEAGLRSHHLLHPFPEELVRVVVMHVSDLLFAPDATAVANLRRMRLRGRIVPTSANTVIDALRTAMDGPQPAPGSGPVVVSLHRLENLHRRERLLGLVALTIRIAERWPVLFVLHPPTRLTLERHGLLGRLEHAGVELRPLLPHDEFARVLLAAPFVVTDGGSIQEESAALGIPCLLWRDRTERGDGLGSTTVLAHYDDDVVERFLDDPQRHRGAGGGIEARPSEEVLEVLLAESSSAGG